MEFDKKEFEQLKRDVAKLRSEADRTDGALAAALDTLKKDFGAVTLLEAETKLTQTERDAAQKTAKYRDAFVTFQKELENEVPRD